MVGGTGCRGRGGVGRAGRGRGVGVAVGLLMGGDMGHSSGDGRRYV